MEMEGDNFNLRTELKKNYMLDLKHVCFLKNIIEGNEISSLKAICASYIRSKMNIRKGDVWNRYVIYNRWKTWRGAARCGKSKKESEQQDDTALRARGPAELQKKRFFRAGAEPNLIV